MSKTSKIRWRRDIANLAKERGWELEKTNGGHLRLKKGNHSVVCPSSPSNPWRSMMNTIAIMRKCENDSSGIQ